VRKEESWKFSSWRTIKTKGGHCGEITPSAGYHGLKLEKGKEGGGLLNGVPLRSGVKLGTPLAWNFIKEKGRPAGGLVAPGRKKGQNKTSGLV